MTLFIIIDETKGKNYCAYEHSNWHHLKIISKMIKYGQSDMFGGKHYKEISSKEIMKLMDKNSNGGLEFEEFKDFRKFNNLDDCSIDGYVIFKKCKDDFDGYNEIYINTSSNESDREYIINSLRNKLQEVKNDEK